MHPTPRRTYYIVFALLAVLTVTTVGVSVLELGRFHVVAALLIAFTKATLVVLFFMHVYQSSSLTKLFVCSGLIWLAILFTYSFGDYVSRDTRPAPQSVLSEGTATTPTFKR